MQYFFGNYLSTGLHHLPLFSQLRSPLFWPHGSMSFASFFCALITLFSITQLSTLCPKVQIIFLENYNFNVCVVLFAFFGISAQWICYFMHWVNWNCQTNTYLVWHLGSITLVSPSSACVPPPVHCSPFLGRTSHLTATPCFLSAKMQNCEQTLQVVIYNTNHTWSALSEATWWIVG